MSLHFQKFDALHKAKDLFVLPNAWDARSAQLFEENKFQAVGTSSAAVAGALGYEDGEGMPLSDYLFVIRRIVDSIKIPFTVDMEMGYGKTREEIRENVLKVAYLGVAGINIEDSILRNSVRSLQDADNFARTIEYIKNGLTSKSLKCFINLRSDTYILGVADALKETKRRLGIYNSSGADGIFLPVIKDTKDISEAVAATSLPINVMCLPGLPGLDELNSLGVKRVSMGPFMFNKIYGAIGQLSQAINTAKNFSPIF